MRGWIASVLGMGVLVLAAAGCGRKAPAPTGRITPGEMELGLRLYQVNVNYAVEARNEYALVDRAWLAGTLRPAYEAFLAQQGASYKAGVFECGDFAMGAAWRGRTEALKEGWGRGPALGEYWYITETGDGHAVNVVFCPDPQGKLPLTRTNGTLVTTQRVAVVFWEPQAGQVTELTRAERDLGLWARF